MAYVFNAVIENFIVIQLIDHFILVLVKDKPKPLDDFNMTTLSLELVTVVMEET